MVPILDLWLPILLSAVLVFVVSSIVHMVLPLHRSDYRPLPDEEKVLDALRTAGVTPGAAYHFPYCTHKDMKSPAVQEKRKRGPVGLMTIMPSGVPNMGKFLGAWFVYCVFVGVFVAYLSGRVLGPTTEYLAVFRVAGTVAFMAYGVGVIPESIWKGQTWGVTFKHIFDGLLYALVTAGAFGWLWPRG